MRLGRGQHVRQRRAGGSCLLEARQRFERVGRASGRGGTRLGEQRGVGRSP